MAIAALIDSERSAHLLPLLQMGQLSNSFYSYKGLPALLKVVCANYHTVYLDIEGKVWYSGSSAAVGSIANDTDIPILLPGLPASAIFIDIEADGEYTLLLDSERRVWICGFDIGLYIGRDYIEEKEELAPRIITEDLPQIQQMSCSESCIVLLDINGFITIISSFVNYGNLGFLPKINKVACCGQDICLVDVDGYLWVHGNNSRGNLGLNRQTQTNNFEKVTTFIDPTTDPTIPSIIDVKVYVNYTCLLDANGNIWICGCIISTSNWKYFTKIPTTTIIVKIIYGGPTTFLVDSERNYWEIGLATRTQQTTDYFIDTPIKIQDIQAPCYLPRTKSAKL